MFSKDGEAALQRNGGETRAPKNSYGCKHFAMKDMNRVSVSKFNFYLKEGEAFHDERCSGKNCPHGLTGKPLAHKEVMWGAIASILVQIWMF